MSRLLKSKVNHVDPRIISYYGEFVDKNLEKEFFNIVMKKAVKFIRPFVLLLGILFFLFIIPDYFFIKNSNSFKIVLYIRIIITLIIFEFYFKIKFITYDKLATWVTIYELITSLSFLFIYYQYDSANFLIQDLGLIIIILAIFLSPNRWINKVISTLIISIGFFCISLLYLKNIRISEFSAAVVYTLLAIIFSSISEFRANYFERKQYLSHCQLIKSSTTDTLTGTYNRLKFEFELDNWVSYANINKVDLSLAMLDIDYFKRINDTFGHQVGDNILKHNTQIIQKSIRYTDIFARWGGDEFVILFPNTNLEDAVQLIDRVRIEINNSLTDQGNITCSFGVVSINDDEDSNSFLKRADDKLYEAKGAGRNFIMS